MKKPSSLLFLMLTASIFSCSTPDNQTKTENSTAASEPEQDSVAVVKNDPKPEVENTDSLNTVTNTPKKQADFERVLTYKNIAFVVKASGKGSLQDVTIQTSGLTATNQPETLKTEPLMNAEIGDLNADGYPELLLFTQSAGSGSYGKVVAFSVNNGKSMSRVTFPEIGQNQVLKKGYGGHDKFTLQNNVLTQEFPIYNEGDTNSKPSGKMRQITYKLKNGEASRVFVVDQVKDVPAR